MIWNDPVLWFFHCWNSFYLQCMATGASSAVVPFWVHLVKGQAMRTSVPWGLAPTMSSWRPAPAIAKMDVMPLQPSLLGPSSFSSLSSPQFSFSIWDYYDAWHSSTMVIRPLSFYVSMGNRSYSDEWAVFMLNVCFWVLLSLDCNEKHCVDDIKMLHCCTPNPPFLI